MSETASSPAPSPVLNVDAAEEHTHLDGEHWGGHYKIMTPLLELKKGSLGVSYNRTPPGRAGTAFHAHTLEDEVFFIISGKGVLRYGEQLYALRAGDCVSCPAGTGIAHQLANTGTEDLVYLGIGRNDPNEVCVYPDSGKVMVRSLKTVGYLNKADYNAGEPDVPIILQLAEKEGL